MRTPLDIALAVLSPNVTQTAITFGLLAIVFHSSIRNIEIDTYLWPLFAVYLLSWISLVAIYANLFDLSFLYSVAAASYAGLCFNLALVASMTVYRLFFHRLRSFPGPWGAKLSRFYAVYLSSKNMQYHIHLQNMHRRYGDFVRTGPREISINRASAVQAAHGSQSSCRKSTWYSQVSGNQAAVSINAARDPEVHRHRRRAWDRGFSVKAMTTYTPRVRSKVDSFISQLHARAGQPVNITEWSMFLTFDVMGVVGFSKDFHQLEDAKEHSVIKGVHDQMATIGLLSQVPWFLYLLGSIPGLTGTYYSFMEYCARQVNEKKALWEKTESQDPVDIISWLLKAVKDKDSSAPPSDRALQDDGRVVIIAGSDTTGATLANAFYFLATNQHIYKQLQRDLDTLFSDVGDSFTYEQVRNIPYVEAIIHETLRLKPAVPSGPPRVTPPGGLQVDEVWIPGDVNILVPPYILQRDDRNFVAADKFMPERWLGENKKRMILNDQAFFPFQIGPYGCVGKQLAYMNLRLAIVLVALNFDLGLAPGEDGVEFDKGAKDTFTLTLSPLQVIFNERAKA